LNCVFKREAWLNDKLKRLTYFTQVSPQNAIKKEATRAESVLPNKAYIAPE